MTISLFVPGTPAPQGSAKAFTVAGKARITHGNPRTMPWRQQVTAIAQAQQSVIVWPRPEAVALQLTFVMPRRASEPKTFTPMHTRKPDLDKLTRAALDSLTGVLFEDDSQVTSLTCEKRTAVGIEQPGLHVHATTARDPHPKPAHTG